jgi:hypothetical protein
MLEKQVANRNFPSRFILISHSELCDTCCMVQYVIHCLMLCYIVLCFLSSLSVVVAQVDPRIPLPQRFINFVIKNLAGVFLSLFQRQVVKV